MSRDLFKETFGTRPAPKRSTWTILGSLAAHVAVVLAVLVVPLVSATENFVSLARSLSYVAPLPAVMPAMPVARPPVASRKLPSNVNPEAAPSVPPEQPVQGDATTTRGSSDLPPGVLVSDTTAKVIGAGRESNDTSTYQPPPPRPRAPLPIGGDIKPPSRLVYVPPIYPEIAKTARVEGTVILEAVIDEAGHVKDVRVLRSIPLLDAAAREAVIRWRYMPTRLNGVPVPVILSVTVTFSLR